MLTIAPLRSFAEHPLDVLHLTFWQVPSSKALSCKHERLLTYSNSANTAPIDSSEREILRQKSLPCVGTPANFILVFRTLPNRLGRIIY